MSSPAAEAVLISASELAVALAGPNPPVLLDVRWKLGDPDGHRHYLDGHIRSAVFVDLDTELADPPAPLGGRHPLPPVLDLQESARRWGIRRGGRVVVYDDSDGLAAARAWWLLRWAGLPDVRILDGALAAWLAAGGALASGPEPAPTPGDIVLNAGHLPVVDADGAADLARTGVLLDARAGERFRGEIEPIDPRAGHIPGATSAPTTENLGNDGRFLAPDELAQRFAALGVDPDASVGVYCGSGITAAHQIAALAVVGVDAALFPGSWSAWSSDPERPVAP